MENLILLHKIDTQGMPKTKASQKVAQYIAQIKHTFIDIKKLKVTNIFLPTCEVSNVQVLYPLPQIISNDPINAAKMTEVVDAINDLVNNKDKIIS